MADGGPRVMAASRLEEILYKLCRSCGLCVCDEAVVLPSAGRSLESGAFKNVVFRLSSTDTDLNPDIFSRHGLWPGCRYCTD